jgi:hypothetical protein
MSRREQVRDADLANPTSTAKSLNAILRNLCLRLEAVEQVRFVEMDVTSGSDINNTIPAITIEAPPWMVRGVYLAKLFDVTNSAPAFSSETLMWTVQDGKLSIPAMYMTLPSNRYRLTFELRGGPTK